MSRTGPVTKDTTTVALGLAQIRLGASGVNVTSDNPVFTSSNSIGVLANTKFTSTVEHWKLESGFPMLEDMTIALKESAKIECAFKEITPQNLAYARGIDASSGYTSVHSGEIALGNIESPAYIRMEALYTYPDGDNQMVIIFPRAQAISSVEIDMKEADAAAVPVTFEAKRADSEISGGSSVWDSKPLGRIMWRPTP